MGSEKENSCNLEFLINFNGAMTIKKCIFLCLLILVSRFVGAQETLLCPAIISELKIENSSDIPETSPNPDGTFNLTFAQDYITALFSNYIIYDFYQTYPNSSSEEALKYFTLSYNSKSLAEDILTQIPFDVCKILSSYSFDTLPIRTPINSEFIEAVEGNSYDVTQFKSTSDADPCQNNPCTLFDVPADFNFRVIFNYDVETELLIMESDGTTSCGNEF